MKKKTTYTLALLGILVALILILWFGVGTINLGFVRITLAAIPVIVGALVLGVRSGLILAFCFGTVSFILGLNQPTQLIAPIFQASVVWGALLCYLPRLMIPVFIGLIRKATGRMNEKLSLALSACGGSLTNTVLYLGFIVLLYAAMGFENPTLLSTVGTTVLVGGLPEAAVAAILCPAIYLALKKAHLIRE